MAKVERLSNLLRALEKLDRESRRKNNGSVVVGYAASYALYVHENKEARHKSGKQWKFLEQPTRELDNSGELGRIVIDAVSRGVGVVKGLVLAGLRIQRESQKIVPVDTANLKGSAFTEQE